MKREAVRIGEEWATGIYIPEEGEEQPQCTWSWDMRTCAIKDHTVSASVYVGYATVLADVLNPE